VVNSATSANDVGFVVLRMNVRLHVNNEHAR
jgi:hypothetical protein